MEPKVYCGTPPVAFFTPSSAIPSPKDRPALPLPSLQPAESLSCWEKFTQFWRTPSPAEQSLIDIEENLEAEWEHNRHILLHAVFAVSDTGGNVHSPLGKRVQRAIQNLEPAHLDDLLSLASQAIVDEQKFSASMSLLRFLSTDQFEQILQSKKIPELSSLEELIGCFLVDIDQSGAAITEKQSFVEKIIAGVKSTFSPVLSFFPNLLDVFIRAFGLEDTCRTPVSVWDYSAMLEIYLKVFLFPHAVSVFVGAFLVVAWQVFLVTAIIVAALVILLSIYIRWIRPCPNAIPQMKNYTEEVKKSQRSPIIDDIRSDKINEILSIIGQKKDHSSYLNAVLVGPSGAGKSELFKALAWECLQRKEMKDKKIFYINVADLCQQQFSCPIEKLINLYKYVGRHKDKVIFCLDEIQALVGKGASFDTLKRLIEDEGIQCIAATTEAGWDKICEADFDGSIGGRFNRVDIAPIGNDTDLLRILRDKVRQSAVPINIEEDVLEKIINETNVSIEAIAQPKKAIQVLVEAINHVQTFNPQRYKHESLSVKEKELAEVKRAVVHACKKRGVQGILHANELFETKLFETKKTLEAEIVELREKNARWSEKGRTVQKLLKQQEKLERRLAEILRCFQAEKLGSEANRQDLKKEFLWIVEYLRPHYQAIIDEEMMELPEDMLLTVNEALVDKIMENRNRPRGNNLKDAKPSQ